MSHIFALSFWGFSSAGSEHLPYKQRVGGSNPSTPTNKNRPCECGPVLFLEPEAGLPAEGR